MMQEPRPFFLRVPPELQAEARVPMKPRGAFVIQVRAGELWAAVDHPIDSMRFNDTPDRVVPWPWEPNDSHWLLRPCLAIRLVGEDRWAVYLRGVLVGHVLRDDVARAVVSFYQ